LSATAFEWRLLPAGATPRLSALILGPAEGRNHREGEDAAAARFA